MSKYYKISEPMKMSGPKKQKNEIFRGEGWYITQDDEIFNVHYLSGHFASESKVFPVSKDDAELLGKQKCDLLHLLKKYDEY